MYELSLQRWLNQTIVINEDKIENLSSLLSFAYRPHPILDHLPLNLGSERSLNIIWAALMLPQLTEKSSNVVPTWMNNATVLGTHFSNG